LKLSQHEKLFPRLNLDFLQEGENGKRDRIKPFTQIKLFNSSKSFVAHKTLHNLFNCVDFEASVKLKQNSLWRRENIHFIKFVYMRGNIDNPLVWH
jgi:hypothetical protein